MIQHDEEEERLHVTRPSPRPPWGRPLGWGPQSSTIWLASFARHHDLKKQKQQRFSSLNLGGSQIRDLKAGNGGIKTLPFSQGKIIIMKRP